MTDEMECDRCGKLSCDVAEDPSGECQICAECCEQALHQEYDEYHEGRSQEGHSE